VNETPSHSPRCRRERSARLRVSLPLLLVAGGLSERLSRVGERSSQKSVSGAPDLIIEVSSPNDRRPT